MIHVPALPGTPRNRLAMAEIIEKCIKEASMYKRFGIDAVAVENMHDIPYLNQKVGPEIVAAMAIIAQEVKANFEGPTGIQILAAANKEALAVAHCAGLDFIRVEGFVFAHTADEGYIESCAGELLRYRKMLGAGQIMIFTDIKKKHSSHSLTSDLDIVETAKAAQFFLSDGVIITGSHTGVQPNIEEVRKVKETANVPVILGSGITDKNIEKYFRYADAFIVGSFFKRDGDWKNEVQPERLEKFMKVRMSLE